jgi:hypothetical protein
VVKACERRAKAVGEEPCLTDIWRCFRNPAETLDG